MELSRFLVEGCHGHGQHLRVGPVIGQRALGHDDDKGPALRVVAHSLGQADLRLPHALRTSLAASMQKQNDRPLLVVFAAPFLRQVDLEAVGSAVQFDPAVQKACLLLILRPAGPAQRLRALRRKRPEQSERQAAKKSSKTRHNETHSDHYIG